MHRYMSVPTSPSGAARVTSLRTRWNRAFALLAVLVVLSGTASVLSTRLLVGAFRDSANRVEREITSDTQLRGDVTALSVVFAGPTDATWAARIDAGAAKIQTEFAQAITNEQTPGARRLLEAARVQWQSQLDAGGSTTSPTDPLTRGTATATHAPKVLALLGRAGATSRSAVRDDLARASRIEHRVIFLLALLGLLTIAMAVSLARRLSTQVLRPVASLQDSALHLTAGELDHRAVVDRADELGDLAVSFNAMADAISDSQRTLTHEANTDALSGLANRTAFGVRLAATLERPNRRSGDQAVLFVDLDDFKDVNDTLGHAAGDELLQVAAGRLLDAVRPGDLVARLGGDEFAVLLDGLPEPAVALAVAQRVVTALADPVQTGSCQARVGASVGLAMRREDSTVGELMREADVAMYAAKTKGKNRVELYDPSLDHLAIQHRALKSDLDVAVARGELVVDYQPMVDLGTGELVGMEALVRWAHPTRGLLPPSEFIELAEESGAIVGIGAFVLATATHHLHDWQRRFRLPSLWVSVNVSVSELERANFTEGVTDVLRDTGLDPTTLVLEVTETVLADPTGGVAGALAALRRAGVRIALDDFGSGFSSIGYLRQFPIDVLKIDRSFLSGTTPGGRAGALLEAIVAMGARLGLDVIPEGIEEPEQLSRLRAMGCRIGQGFLMSRPVSASAIEALLVAPVQLPVPVA